MVGTYLKLRLKNVFGTSKQEVFELYGAPKLLPGVVVGTTVAAAHKGGWKALMAEMSNWAGLIEAAAWVVGAIVLLNFVASGYRVWRKDQDTIGDRDATISARDGLITNLQNQLHVRRNWKAIGEELEAHYMVGRDLMNAGPLLRQDFDKWLSLARDIVVKVSEKERASFDMSPVGREAIQWTDCREYLGGYMTKLKRIAEDCFEKYDGTKEG